MGATASIERHPSTRIPAQPDTLPPQASPANPPPSTDHPLRIRTLTSLDLDTAAALQSILLNLKTSGTADATNVIHSTFCLAPEFASLPTSLLPIDLSIQSFLQVRRAALSSKFPHLNGLTCRRISLSSTLPMCLSLSIFAHTPLDFPAPTREPFDSTPHRRGRKLPAPRGVAVHVRLSRPRRRPPRAHNRAPVFLRARSPPGRRVETGRDRASCPAAGESAAHAKSRAWAARTRATCCSQVCVGLCSHECAGVCVGVCVGVAQARYLLFTPPPPLFTCVCVACVPLVHPNPGAANLWD